MDFKAEILDCVAIGRALKRVAHEIVEHNEGCEDVVLVGIKTRGVFIAERIAKNIEEFENCKIPVGILDITPHRDDIDLENSITHKNCTQIDFDVTAKNVILIDDVLFTGRTVRAGIDAIMSLGRPKSIQLAVLIDRGHRELPIRADYVGKNLPTSKSEDVSVRLIEADDKDIVCLYLLNDKESVNVW